MPSYQIKQSSTAYPLVFLLVSSTDHIAGVPGLSPTVKIRKPGGTGISPSGTVTEIDATNMPGWYQVAGNATDSGTLGPLLLHATGTGADPCDMLYEVVAVDPQSTAFGLTLAKTTNLTGFNDIAATAIVSGGAITTSGGKASASVDAWTVGSISTSITGNITGNLSGSVGSVTGAIVLPTGTGAGQISLTGGKVAATLASTDVTGNVACDLQTIKTQVVTCAAGVTVLASVGTASTSTAQTGDSFARIGAAGAGLTAVTGVTLAASQHVIVDSGTVTTLTNLPAIPANWLTGTGVDATAVTKVQAGLATPTNITAGTITTVTNLTNAPTAGDFTATMKASITTAATAATPTAAAVTGAVGSVTGAVGSVTGNVGGNVTGSVGSVVGAVGSVTGAVGSVAGLTASDVGAIRTVTDHLGTALELNAGVYRLTVAALANSPSGSGGGMSLANLQSELDTRGLTGTWTASVATTSALTGAVAPVKAKTDGLVFTTTGRVDATVQGVGSGFTGQILPVDSNGYVLADVAAVSNGITGQVLPVDTQGRVISVLPADGLDAITTTAPTGSAAGWKLGQMIAALFHDAFGAKTKAKSGTTGTITTRAVGTTTTFTSRATTDDGAGNQTIAGA